MRILLLSLLSLIMAMSAHAQTVNSFMPGQDVRVDASLLVEQAYVEPGNKVTIALHQDIEEGWHTYWYNPGDSGEPVQLTWDLPEGFEASPLSYPVPKAIPYGPLMNFGYKDEAVFLADITVPNGAEGFYELKAHAFWLVCADICIPEEANLTVGLNVITGALDPNDGSLIPDNPEFSDWKSKLPLPASFNSLFQASTENISLSFDLGPLAGDKRPDIRFFPLESGLIENASAQEVRWTNSGPIITTKVGYKLADEEAQHPGSIEGLLVIEEETADGVIRAGYQITATPGVIASSNPDGLTLPAALAFAFLGGLILNLMPCVFPVLFIKVLGLLKTKELSPAHARMDGLVYMVGVLVSFLTIAGLLIGLRQSGELIGWGYQLQNPVFVFILTALMFVIGLSLITQLNFGAGLAGTGDQLARRSGLTGTFFTGVLATVVATPCTAPFMAAALGYALSRPPVEALSIFAFLGLGMAAPFTLACFYPPLLARLPKPGPWMETVRQFFAFPMFAAAAWLGWVLSEQIGPTAVLYLSGAAIGLSFLFWLESKIQNRSTGWLTFSAGIAIIIFTAFTINGNGTTAPVTAQSLKEDSYGLTWEPFSREAIKTGLSEGRPVFVNMTAAWCITCKVNERLVFTSDKVKQTLDAKNVLLLKGDWTNYDPAITTMLEDYGRSGVPLYLYFSEAEPNGTLLPQILTEEIFLNAL